MITKNVKLWLGDGPLVRVRVSQFDTMWRFVFSIVNNSQTWTIPEGASAVLNGRKPDGNVFAFSGTIANNKVTVDCDVQMTACAGDTICELSILADGKTVGTANFTLAVEAAPKSPDDVSSDSALPAYAEMLEMFSGDIEDEVDSWLNAHSSQIGGLTNEAKQALLALLAHVAYTDDQGQTYLDALETALYPPVDLTSITAVFAQGDAVVYDTDTLDTLKQYLTVTALYSDSSTEVVTAYTLSGTLTEGTSTIVVSYGGKTTTFNVTVSAEPSYVTNGLVHRWDAIDNTRSGHSSTTTTWEDLVGNIDLTKTNASSALSRNSLVVDSKANPLYTAENLDYSENATIEICFKYTNSNACVFMSCNPDPSVSIGARNSRRIWASQAKLSGVSQNTNTFAFPTDTDLASIRNISVTYDDRTVSNLYVNGVPTTLTTTTGQFMNTDSYAIAIGSAGGQYPFSGQIFAVRIYNRKLTEAEIAQNYAMDYSRFELGE